MREAPGFESNIPYGQRNLPHYEFCYNDIFTSDHFYGDGHSALLTAVGNWTQIIIIYMVSYCAWNKHNNLSSRALIWHTYHHDVFAYIEDISFLNILKDRCIAVRKEEKIQVSLSSWLSIKRSEKGDRFALCSLQFVIQHHSPDITGTWKEDPRMRHKTKPKIASLFKVTSTDRVTHPEVLSQISKSIIFKQKPFIYKVFLWWDGSLYRKRLIISDKKYFGYQVTMQWRFWVSSLVALY